LLLLGLTAAPAVWSHVIGLPLEGQPAVEFLHSARIEGKPERFDVQAITEPTRVILTDGRRTHRAIFKDVDAYHMVFRHADGKVFTKVRDSYKHEIAAYELDALLELGMVPPCVERTIQGRIGSLCLWVENAMTEAERTKKGLRPTDVGAWNDQMLKLRLFHQLLADLDYNNTRNTLVDADFRLYKVDSSLSFRIDPELRNEGALIRLPRELLSRLESLNRADLDERLGEWLDKEQLDALWARRERVLGLAEERERLP
jgi:hypothetical protein